ncbi:MAG TPA: hypothetical protein VEH06_06185 [Candidatus Bathyarchaeia archaeon]|nr:hypothetical protein [Candidatus Bathyarchaeia archaeon]
MVQKHIVISMIAPVAIAGILIMAILANQAYSSSGSLTSVKCKITKHGHTKCKTKTITPPPQQGSTSQQSSNTGNGATSEQSSNTGNGRTNILVHNPPTSSQQSSNAGNAAQGASTIGEGGRSSQTTGGTVAQEGPGGQGGHCKAAVTALSASWYSPYSLYQIRGKLTCGGSGIVGKTITLTSSKLSYVGKFGTAVTREDGYFSANYRPTSTGKPLTTVSAWYLGGPDEGGLASKTVTPQGGPQSSNGNAAQGASNTAQGAAISKAGHCKAAITLQASYYPPYRNWNIRGDLTCGGSGLGGKTITLTNSNLSDVGKLTTLVTDPAGQAGTREGAFGTSQLKPSSGPKPGSPLSAWYLGGPDEGGLASKTVTLPPAS